SHHAGSCITGSSHSRSSSQGLDMPLSLENYEAQSSRPRRIREKRRTTCGQLFLVEYMPADHSCGFHGIGISRQEAATLLRRHRADPEIQELVASDLLAALQTGERCSFPEEIRSDQRLWDALASYYAAQQALDANRREAKDFLAEGSEAEAFEVAEALEASRGDLSEALQRLFAKLKSKAEALPSGAE
ncbi:unnamed protein product, partial [Polarella glacialis]